jgi:hypothetical protein
MPGDNLYAQVFAGAVVESGHMVRGSHSHHNLASMHQSGGQSPFYSQQNQHHAYQHSSNLPPHHPQSMSASHSFNNLLSLQRQLQQQQQQPKQPEVVSELTQAQLIALVESLSSLEVSHLTARTASHADLLAAVAGQGRPAASFLSAPPSHDEHASFDSSAFGSSTLNAAASPFPAPSSYASDQSIRRATSMPSMSTRCPNQRLGCNWHGTLELHAAHLAECPCQSVRSTPLSVFIFFCLFDCSIGFFCHRSRVVTPSSAAQCGVYVPTCRRTWNVPWPRISKCASRKSKS